MTTIVNFERDMFWTDIGAEVSWVLGTYPGAVGTSGVVGQRFSAVQFSGSLAAGSISLVGTVGCQILPPPDGDSVPYRVKGCVSGGPQVAYGYGYVTAPTTFVRPRCFASGHSCDEVVLVPPLAPADPQYGLPLVFFVALFRGAAATNPVGGLSVQRLIAKPPQFATAVS